jgi:hypothetical protein
MFQNSQNEKQDNTWNLYYGNYVLRDSFQRNEKIFSLANKTFQFGGPQFQNILCFDYCHMTFSVWSTRQDQFGLGSAHLKRFFFVDILISC